MSTHRFAATASLPSTDSKQEPRFSITRGNPTPEDVAALLAMVTALDAADAANSGNDNARRAQSRRMRLGIRLRPGFSAWRRTRPEQ